MFKNNNKKKKIMNKSFKKLLFQVNNLKIT